MGISLYLSPLAFATPDTELFISKNDNGTLGYLQFKRLPIHKLYTIIDIRNMRCGAHIQGYTKEQGKRLILHTYIHDPNASAQNQCSLTLLRNKNKITIINSDNCQAWYGIGCAFTSTTFIKTH